MARTVKDIVCRYKTMKGFLVERKAGWDTHGLPVEIEVEKSLHLNGKDDIEKLGVGEFNKQCKNSVFHYHCSLFRVEVIKCRRELTMTAAARASPAMASTT